VTAPQPPAVWWTPSQQHEFGIYPAIRWCWDGSVGTYVEPDDLPVDAIRLVAAPDVAKLAEMAGVIEDAVAHTHQFDGLGDHEDWLIETARQLRLLAAPIASDAAAEPDVPEETCPDCEDEPEMPDIHRVGCPRIGTTGQDGPPWLPPPWTALAAPDTTSRRPDR
jgi:hypothetical protein